MSTERPKLTMKLADLPGWIERLIRDIENPVFNNTPAEIANALRHMLKTLFETPQAAQLSMFQKFEEGK